LHINHFQFLIKGYLHSTTHMPSTLMPSFNSSLKDTVKSARVKCLRVRFQFLIKGYQNPAQKNKSFVLFFQFLIKGYRQCLIQAEKRGNFQFLIKGYANENAKNYAYGNLFFQFLIKGYHYKFTAKRLVYKLSIPH